MNKVIIAAVAFAFAAALSAQPVAAQSASAEEIKICEETIREMTGGKPPADAVKLCKEGKLNEAIEKAMAGACGMRRHAHRTFPLDPDRLPRTGSRHT